MRNKHTDSQYFKDILQENHKFASIIIVLLVLFTKSSKRCKNKQIILFLKG